MDDNKPAASDAPELIGLTVDLLSAYLSNNTVPFAELPGLVGSVHAAMAQLGGPQTAPAQTYTPAVSVKKSVTPDALISLIDGKPYKTLKRHLTGHGLTPQAYRERYGLPKDYPMSAANYSAQRSALARSIGLGAGLSKQVAKAADPDPVVKAAPRKRAPRKPKA